MTILTEKKSLAREGIEPWMGVWVTLLYFCPEITIIVCLAKGIVFLRYERCILMCLLLCVISGLWIRTFVHNNDKITRSDSLNRVDVEIRCYCSSFPPHFAYLYVCVLLKFNLFVPLNIKFFLGILYNTELLLLVLNYLNTFRKSGVAAF